MAVREWPLTADTSSIDPDDLVPTANAEAGLTPEDILIKSRSMQQLREYFSSEVDEFSANASGEFNITVGTYTLVSTTPSAIVVDSTMRPPTPATRASELEYLVLDGRNRVEYADWNALASIDAQSLPADGLTDTNSLPFTIGSVVYRVAKATNVAGATNTTDEYFAYSASVAGSYDLTVNYIQLALELYADRNSPTTLVPLTRQEKELPDLGNPGQRLTVNAAGDALEYQTPTTGGGGTGDDEKLIRLVALPAITGYNVGDIINLNGDLYELVANTEDSNVLRGTIYQRAGNYWGSVASGEAELEFQGIAPNNVHLKVLKTGLPSPPLNIYMRAVLSSGETADIIMGRADPSDTTTRYNYNRDPQSSSVLDVPTAGETYTLTLFSDTGFSVPLNVHAAHRWEVDNRDTPVSDIALVGNTDRWPKAKLPADTAYGDQIQQRLGVLIEDETFPGFTLLRTDTSATGSAAVDLFSPTLDLDDNPHGESHS